MKKENLEVSKSKRITNADRAFIVRNLEVIAHELAHIMYCTTDNTKEHEVAQGKLPIKFWKDCSKSSPLDKEKESVK